MINFITNLYFNTSYGFFPCYDFKLHGTCLCRFLFYLYSMHECLKKELNFSTSRSSGPGGQHVNKIESRVALSWSVEESICLNERQKLLIKKRLSSRLTNEGILMLVSEKFRSQYQNREDVTERFLALITSSLVPVKKRKPTRPTRSSVERRIKKKKIRGEIKRLRRGNPED